jgi:hypothetical protein
MTIDLPQAPDGFDEVQKGLSDLATHPSIMAFTARSQSAEAAPPLEVHILTRKEIANAEIDAQRAPQIWRYLISRADGWSAADLTVKPIGGLAFSRVSHGFAITQLHKALDMADRDFAHAPEHLMLRIVEAPALQAAALWLQGPRSDLFIPYLDGTKQGPELRADPHYLQSLKLRQAAMPRPPENDPGTPMTNSN